MQEIKKRRIVLASVLKPVDDPRMYEKMGRSLSRKYDVHILGFPITQNIAEPRVTFHPHASFRRLSFRRMITSWIIFRKILSLSPEFVIIATHELLFQAMLLKLFTKTRVYYDIQENYYLNVLHTNAFPRVLRPVIAGYVRAKERLTSRWIDRFIVAEQTYLKELPFTRGKATVVENKFAFDPRVSNLTSRGDSINGTRFLFSGTLSRTTGVFDAVQLVSLLHEQDKNVSLTIAGYSSRTEELQDLRKVIRGKGYITLIGGNSLVPHSQILTLVRECSIGVISYPPNPATYHRIPTKLYEYMACRLPILTTNVFPWADMVVRHKAGIVYNPDEIKVESIIKTISENDFYPAPISGVLWETEEQALFSIFDEAK